MMNTQISRRNFGRTAALLGAASTLPFPNEHALAQLSMIGPLPADAVKINANENPMGPCPEAVEAMMGVIRGGGRYLYEETFNFGRVLAEQEGLRPDYVRPFPGSSEPLHRAVLAFTSPEKSFVTADPGYEAGERAAQVVGARVVKVPLTSGHAHDVKAMAKADPNAGLIYVCNPNNPTGTLTRRADLDWLVANKPAGAVVLVDEAYIHIAPSGKVSSDMVAADKDVLVLRTFSKLYGMAGLRAGAAMARPDILAKISQYGAGALPVTGMVGATASLKSKTLVPERRKIIADVRTDVFEFLDKKGMSFVTSDSNKFMLDVKRPGYEVVNAMAAEKVFIGRVWSAWPTHVRVSIGTREEMAKFKTAITKVMQA
ncbi:MAG TPA: pyridoxal phosphate-dependent aminotransferase [Bryobacteraceae bacterium]|nr:pyridoxal phosphate-dependent aminotransferase [Bryobacteraceae bacterium]